jgi:hypothetical protein
VLRPDSLRQCHPTRPTPPPRLWLLWYNMQADPRRCSLLLGLPAGNGPTTEGETCGRIIGIPHDVAEAGCAGSTNQRRTAMRKMGSADESPHVVRVYLRPDEANAVIEAAGRVAGSASATKCCFG